MNMATEQEIDRLRKENEELKRKLNPYMLCECGWSPEIKVQINPMAGMYGVGAYTFLPTHNPEICPNCSKRRFIASNR